jgi:hypothetical protein
MNIQKLKLLDNGLRGLKITHLVQEIKDGYPFQTPTVSEPKYPIHLGLEKKFKELREHLLNVCEICQNPRDEDEFTYNVNDTDITEIEIASDGFRLKGNKKMTETKVITLKTYFVEEGDGYVHYDAVRSIIGEILEEVREYVAGNKQISTDELSQRIFENLIKKGKKSDMSELEGMNDEEKKEYCKSFLLANGAIDIVMQDDLDLPADTPILNLQKTA